MSAQGEVIETTVGNVAAELVRRGLDPHDRVTITIEPDEDIDRMIKQAQQGAEPRTE
jgi:hypothetical protein